MLLTLAPVNIMAQDKESGFTDVKDTDYYAQAATTLAELNILAGYPDGTFGPEKSITRAEMAVVVCKMIDKDTEAQKAKGKTKFSDVEEGSWATGYINVASEEGIISGDGDGTFRPGDNVKYEEAIKMIVCALGYGDDIEVDASDWSKGYIEVAKEKGITDDLKGSKGEASTRGDVAVMAYNGITVGLSAPVISLKAGTYSGTQNARLSTETEDAVIYYTTDGSEPTENSKKYTDPISITRSCTLKAVAIRNGVSSSVASAEYNISVQLISGGASSSSSRDESDDEYTVSFDLNYDGAVGAPASQTVNKDDCAVAPTTPEREGFAFVGWYVDNTYAELFNFATPITKTYTLVARWVDMNDTTDTDSDGLTDPIEEYYGTDKTKPDTDEDGLTDFFEIKSSSTNPLVIDSDENGTNDADEDFDEDSLTNRQEQENNCNPHSDDTDMDGLTDYDEINTYNTKPDIADTDEDGLDDGDEIELGLNPLVQKTDGETLDSERTFTQELEKDNISAELLSEDNAAIPALTLTANGNINNEVIISGTSSNDFSDSRAIIGEAIDITGDNISEGTISFKLKDEGTSLLAVDDTDETFNTNLICKYNEDGSNEYLDTDYNASTKTLTADIDEAGTYFVLNVQNLFDELGLAMPSVTDLDSLTDTETVSLMSIDEEESKQNNNSNEISEEIVLFTDEDIAEDVNVVAASAETEKVTLMAAQGAMAQADIVFIIDTTGSMGDEINNVKNNINSFVDVLKSKGVSAGLALIDYQDITVDGYDSTRVHKNGTSNWFYNMDDYKTAISNLYLGYGGDEPECAVDALETARLLDMRASAGKIFVLVTDANYKVDNRYGIPSMAAEIELLKNAGVSCSVISPSYEQSTYYNLYTDTDGIWANIYGNFNTELTALADKIGEEIVGDGYWIYLQGPVPVPVRLNAMPKEGSSEDTDEDGIPDVEELESATPTGEIDLDELITKVSRGVITGTDYGIVKMYKYKSSPHEKDTDFDGFLDKEDTDPKKWDVSYRDLSILSKAVYSDLAPGTILSEEKIELKTSDGIVASSAEMKGWKVAEAVYNPLTGFEGAAYVNGKNIVIATRGSEDKDLADILQDWVTADIVGFVTGLNWQLPAMETFVKNVVKEYGSHYDNFYVTGHSLGGYLALMAGSQLVWKGVKDKIEGVVTFNGLGLSPMSGIFDVDDYINLGGIRAKVKNYKVEGDIVSMIGTTPGDDISIPMSDSLGEWSVGNAHSLVSFAERFSNDIRKPEYSCAKKGLNDEKSK